ncbi:hypothetical protein BV898_15383 [Hypsibius exemplaris]|uniref:Uncharacterized protein n=1 Tax=Hypsibius exemplaris TaxID=2072580 RepID=A0A9X6NAW9_HYPEX|nr:hypothetical protein BV898_15383 [Hypsibius exemplaris]
MDGHSAADPRIGTAITPPPSSLTSSSSPLWRNKEPYILLHVSSPWPLSLQWVKGCYAFAAVEQLSNGPCRQRPSSGDLRIAELIPRSMAVVFCTLISHVPNYFMSIVPNHASATIRRFGVYLTLVQHCVSPVIYLLFWPPDVKLLAVSLDNCEPL